MTLTFERKIKDDRSGGNIGNCSCRYDIRKNGEWIGAFEYFFQFAGFVIGMDGYQINTRLNFPWFIPFTKDVLIEKNTGLELARLKGFPFPSRIEFKKQKAYHLLQASTPLEIVAEKSHHSLTLSDTAIKIQYNLANEAPDGDKVFYKQNLTGTIDLPDDSYLIVAFAGLHLVEVAIGNIPDRRSEFD
ncbi:MAG TPA: hypothetical protein VK174_09690 [Chitinophagales bacterium]|nr:hypothetical protein [Chitinophagales bacterium]